MYIHYYIGVDVSKATLDWPVFDGEAIILQTQSPNSESGIKAALKLIKVLPGFSAESSICCLEHTGIYNALILQCLSAACFPTWLESSLQIKQAGVCNGASLIGSMLSELPNTPAAFRFRFRDQLRLWQPPPTLTRSH